MTAGNAELSGSRGRSLRRELAASFSLPTWAVLVFFRLQSSLPAIPLVLVGALAAASGRRVRAYARRRFGDPLSAERRENLPAARDDVAGGPKRAVAALGLLVN